MNDDGTKPMLVIGSDGGPDEVVKNDKIQNESLWLPKKCQFDAVHARNSSPKNCAGNGVERKMVILTKQMIGKSLSAFKHGKHLKNGRVMHELLRLRNLDYSDKSLAKMFDRQWHDG